MSHISLHQSVVTSSLCASPVRITTAAFLPHIPKICYANAAIRSFSSKLKTTSSLEFSLPSHQKCAPTSATRSPYTPYPARVGSFLFTTLSISWQETNDRAPSVPSCCLPSGIVVSSVNPLNSSYVARTNPLSFKATKSLVLKSLPPLKISICITVLLVSGTASDGAVSDSTNTSQSCVALVQHHISNSKQVTYLDSFNSGDIYLSSSSKFLHLPPQSLLQRFCPYWYHFGVMLFFPIIINFLVSIFDIFN